MPNHLMPNHTMRALATTRVVSATSLSAGAEHRGMLRPVLSDDVRPVGRVVPTREHHAPCPPNYGLRRLVVGAVVAVVIAVGAVAGATLAVGVLGGFGAAPVAAAGDAAPPSALAVHVARPGDTMWSIAATHRGGVSHDRYLDALIRRNGSASIQAGQAIWLP